MRIVFMGTGEIAIPTLDWLLEEASGLQTVGVFTQPDKKVGRKQEIIAPLIKTKAQKHGVPVFQPDSLRKDTAALEELEKLEPDMIVVMAYGQILPNRVIDLPRIDCINLHASLLPRHRGASPIQAAIREGDSHSGITLMKIVPALDAGDMILKSEIALSQTETGGSLHDRLALLGPDLLSHGLHLLASSTSETEEQNEELVTYAGKLLREDGEIDWTKSATEIERWIRAYDPWPGTYTTWIRDGKPQKIKIYPHCSIAPGTGHSPGTVIISGDELLIACGENSSLKLEGELQLEGRKRLPVSEFLRGSQLEDGTNLGS